MSSFQNEQAPVPVPVKLRLRELRIRVLPVLIFLIAGFIVFLLWDQRVQTPDFSGRVLGDAAVLIAPANGYLTEIKAAHFGQAEAGEIVFTLNRIHPEELAAMLAKNQAEIRQLRVSQSPLTPLHRAYVDYLGLQLDLLELQRDLATGQAALQFLQREEIRTRSLFERGLLDESTYENTLRQLREAEAETEATARALEKTQTQLNELPSTVRFGQAETTETMEAALSVLEADTRLIQAAYGPTRIRAPLAGIIRMHRLHEGQFVNQGDTLATIQAAEPMLIEGFLRQPLPVIPQTGMAVEIRSRGVQSARYRASITAVGSAIMPIAADMQRPGLSFESGLPVEIALPPEIRDQFIPGEIVDIRLLGN